MRFFQVLLVAVVSLFASSDLAGAAETNPIKRSTVTSSDALTRGHSIVTRGRSLRVGQTPDAEDGGTEERANLWTKISKPVKLKLWHWADKSDDYVKNALGMKTLSGAALKAHPNYNTYQKFQLNKWYRSDKPTTYDAWVRLKLNEISADTRGHTDEFSTYVRYVNIFDNNAIRAMKAHRKTPPLVSSEASEQEMLARAMIWGLAGRSDEYVKTALGMNGVSAVHYANSQYYDAYMESLFYMIQLKG